MARYWFAYNPGGGTETNPAAFTKLNASPALGCDAGQTLCAVYARENEETGKPNAGSLSAFSNIFAYIGNSRFLGGVPYPIPQPFVYLKDTQ